MNQPLTLAVDGNLMVDDPRDAGPLARRLEDIGFDGATTFEGQHDPFLPLTVAAVATEKIQLGTAIAVAFARNPMLLANLGYDLQLLSRGRFKLGLGSQIRPHIERRFGATWSEPAKRMREMVQAIRAIWACWQNGVALDFRGAFYTHTLMTPTFDPGPNPYGLPPIYIAGVGPRMTEVAGEVGDGMLIHPFNTRLFVETQILPAVQRGSDRAGRDTGAVGLACQFIVATGLERDEIERNRALARQRVAFYASTPAYRPVLECHGWGELQPRLNALSKEGKWREMGDLIGDELFNEVVIHGSPEVVGEQIRGRCLPWCHRVSPGIDCSNSELATRVLRAIREAR